MAKQKNETIVKDDENKKANLEVVIDETDAETPAIKAADTPIEETAVIKPTAKYGYSRFAQFPVEMTLPMRVLAEAGVANRRYQILTSGQDVPEAIIRWMKTDIRYNKWFS